MAKSSGGTRRVGSQEAGGGLPSNLRLPNGYQTWGVSQTEILSPYHTYDIDKELMEEVEGENSQYMFGDAVGNIRFARRVEQNKTSNQEVQRITKALADARAISRGKMEGNTLTVNGIGRVELQKRDDGLYYATSYHKDGRVVEANGYKNRKKALQAGKAYLLRSETYK